MQHTNGCFQKDRPGNRARVLASALALAISMDHVACGQCEYLVTEIPTSSSATEARASNLQGTVTGFYMLGLSGPTKAFTWKDGVTTPLNMPPGMLSSEAYDISDTGGINGQGVVVGTASMLNGVGFRAFIHDGSGYTLLEPLPIPCFTFGAAINNQLVVAGSSQPIEGDTTATMWVDGKLILIEGLPGENSQAVDINDNGVVLGWTGTWHFYDADVFVLDERGITIVGKPPGAFSTLPTAINDLGDITGYGYYPSRALEKGFVRRGFLWSQGVWTDLGDGGPGLRENYAYDINNAGQIVGSLHGPAPDIHYVWQDGVTTPLPGHLNSVRGIDNVGRVTGWNLQQKAVFLVPSLASPGDLDLDCHVSGSDLAMLLGAWGTCGVPCAADLDENGTVDAADLAILLGDWN